MIELRGVSFCHHEHPAAARGRVFSLDIEQVMVNKGEKVACVGPSGSGKTTLLHLIAGVFTPQSGSVRVLGQNLCELSEHVRRDLRLRRIGMVFQEFELLEYLSARDNMLLGSRMVGSPSHVAVRRRAEELADLAGLSGLLDRRPARLSQGERQRVAVCRALVTDPELILCDEPTGNLDPATTSRILDLVLNQAVATDATVVVVTHNHECLGRFDRVLDIDVVSRSGTAALGGGR